MGSLNNSTSTLHEMVEWLSTFGLTSNKTDGDGICGWWQLNSGLTAQIGCVGLSVGGHLAPSPDEHPCDGLTCVQCTRDCADIIIISEFSIELYCCRYKIFRVQCNNHSMMHRWSDTNTQNTKSEAEKTTFLLQQHSFSICRANSV